MKIILGLFGSMFLYGIYLIDTKLLKMTEFNALIVLVCIIGGYVISMEAE